jgi:hypothetical protein
MGYEKTLDTTRHSLSTNADATTVSANSFRIFRHISTRAAQWHFLEILPVLDYLSDLLTQDERLCYTCQEECAFEAHDI